MAFRIKPLSQFIGDAPEASALFMPTQFIPLVGSITYSRYFQAERSGTLGDLQNEANDAFSLECTDLILSLGQLVEQINLVETALSERCQSDGVQALSFKFVREIFERQLTALRTLIGNQYNDWPLDQKYSEAVFSETQSTPDSAEQSGTNDNINSVSSTPDTVSPPDSTPITEPASPPSIPATVSTISTQPLTRDAAYDQLRTLADFFKQTEPHNPTSYLLERAIVWGQLPLPELMKILVGNNSNALNQIDSLIGMNDIPINMKKTIHYQLSLVVTLSSTQSLLLATRMMPILQHQTKQATMMYLKLPRIQTCLILNGNGLTRHAKEKTDGFYFYEN